MYNIVLKLKFLLFFEFHVQTTTSNHPRSHGFAKTKKKRYMPGQERPMSLCEEKIGGPCSART